MNSVFNVIKKPSNLYIVAVEGLDATGKETFVKSLIDYIREFSWGNDVNVIHHAFPTYDSEIGKHIKTILNTPHKERDNVMLDDLMFHDRIVQMINITNNVRLDKRPTILILDRYYFSNFVYSVQNSYLTEKRFELEAMTLPKPNLVIHFIPTTENGIAIHKKQIEEKADKDLNEVYSFQEMLMTKYMTKFKYSVDFYKDLDDTIAGYITGEATLQMMNDVGSNYGNLNKESEIVSLFTSWAHSKDML